jgi:hypothetical protein
VHVIQSILSTTTTSIWHLIVLTDVNPLIIIIITQQTENAYPSIE